MKFFIYLFVVAFLSNHLFSKETEKVTLRLQWKHQFEFAGFYAAKELGYYKNAGIDVDILEYKNGIDIIDEVKNGKIDFGIWGSGVIEESLKDDEVVLLANYFKRSPLVIVSQKNIEYPSDLVGKKLMIPKSDYQSANYIQMFKRTKVNINDIQMVKPTFSIEDFVHKKVDAMTVFLTNEPFLLKEKGIPYNILDPNDYGVTLYDVNLFSSKKLTNNNPKLVKSFIEASNKGWEYALNHSEEIVNLILKKYNSQHKSKKHLLFEAEETKKMILANTYPIGSINEKQIQRISSLFKELGMFTENKELKSQINLTTQEKEFLKQHPIIKVSSELDWPPYDFVTNGISTGYSSDYIKLLAQKAGFEIEFIQDNWANLVDSFKSKKIDIMQVFSKTKERENFTLFTDKPYASQVFGIVSVKNNSYQKLEELYGKKVAMGKGWYSTEMIKKLHPKIQVVEYSSTMENLQAVLKRDVDAAIDSIGASLYYIHDNSYIDLAVKGKIYIVDTDMYFGVRNDWKELLTILEKAKDALTLKEKNELYQKWFGTNEQKNQKSTVNFTQEEQNYINNKKRVTYCFDPIYKPIEFLNQEGSHDGMTKDILDLISQNTGLEFVPQKTTEWSKTLKRLENKECEMIFALTPSTERERYMLFTKPYLELPEVLVNRLESPFINGLEDIKGQKIGILQGDSFIDMIKEKYPTIKLVEFEDTRVALQMLVNGELDGFIEFLPTLSLRMAEIGDKNLKIAGKIDITTLNIASHKTEPILQSILQKSLDAISLDEKQRIKDKWMAIKIEKEFDYSLVWKIGLFVLLIVLAILYINYQLKSTLKEQIDELRKKDALILQQSKHAAMGELIANIAHQWRQPLANLNGLILNFDYENEKNQLDKNKIENYLNQIEELSLHMSNTIEDFSNYFSPNKEKKYFQLEALFGEIEHLLKFSLIKNNIELIVVGETSATIYSYYAELLQVLLILINNSKDAFRQNIIEKPKIIIEVIEKENLLFIELKDNGGGIPNDIIDRVFDPYFTTKNKSQGTGLGLHIVKTLLSNSLNGTIFVENFEQGVKFTIQLEK